jgi:hypothetical protein
MPKSDSKLSHFIPENFNHINELLFIKDKKFSSYNHLSQG